MKETLKTISKYIIIIILTLAFTNLVSLAEYLENEIFNVGVVIKLSSEKEQVETGELHKVKVKNSYANPNDIDYANCKIYLTNEDGTPNEVAKLENLIDNKIIFSCKNNEDLSVTVELKEEKDENGNVIAKYLEYKWNCNLWCQMEHQD